MTLVTIVNKLHKTTRWFELPTSHPLDVLQITSTRRMMRFRFWWRQEPATGRKPSFMGHHKTRCLFSCIATRHIRLVKNLLGRFLEVFLHRPETNNSFFMTLRKDNNPLFTIPTSTANPLDTGGGTIPTSALENKRTNAGSSRIWWAKYVNLDYRVDEGYMFCKSTDFILFLSIR